jgi:hypothetical protein
MTTTLNPKAQRSGRRGRLSSRRNRGGSMVEFAILAPLLMGLIFWANYFWEVQYARIKAAEVARFVAFERTMRSNLDEIVAEAKDRYQDLDGSTKGVEKPQGIFNGITLAVTASHKKAPISGSISETSNKAGGGAGGFLSDISSLMGDSVEAIIGLLGFNMDQGAVQVDVQIDIVNNIVPTRIGFYQSGPGDDSLNIQLKESFFVYHDTWRAWNEGSNPRDTYPTVENITHERVKKIAYIGLADKASGVLGPVEDFLDVLNLEFPLGPDYIRSSVLMRPVKENNRHRTMGDRDVRTVPGDVLQAFYWKDDSTACFDSCESSEIKQKRGLISSASDNANWPMRAYNCRGDFFQGANKSKDPELVYSKAEDKSYFNYGDAACAE